MIPSSQPTISPTGPVLNLMPALGARDCNFEYCTSLLKWASYFVFLVIFCSFGITCLQDIELRNYILGNVDYSMLLFFDSHFPSSSLPPQGYHRYITHIMFSKYIFSGIVVWHMTEKDRSCVPWLELRDIPKQRRNPALMNAPSNSSITYLAGSVLWQHI